MRRSLGLAGGMLLVTGVAHAADQPPPTGPHPRLFLSQEVIDAASANAAVDGTAAQALVERCQETIDHPEYYMDRGGADGDNWPGAAVACAFAWQVTGQQEFLDSAVQYWNVALNDDQTLGDGLGCVVGADAETATTTVRHDTGYPIRWYGPYLALTYDWLHDAPGVDAALLEHTRFCFKAWIDYYTAEGYLRDVPGANYGAGYVAAKTLIAVAEAGEDGATSDAYWNEVVDDVFTTMLIGEGLAGSEDPVGSPAGVLVGGDWAEGWQYGPLSVLEYAFSARALIEHGVPLPEMETWAVELLNNQIYARTPARDGVFSHGDLESDVIYPALSGRVLRAVYGGTTNREVQGAVRMFSAQLELDGGNHPLEAIAEVIGGQAPLVDFNFVERPRSHLTRGTRTLYARSSWGDDAFWSVFMSSPHIVPDHDHVDAGNFVLSRASDHLIVDPSAYGSRSTLPSNAPTVNADTVQGEYKPSQTPWSEAELLWARASQSGVVAARADHANAYNFADTPSDIPFALRDWVFLPEGEVVVLDRVRSNNEAETTILNFHTPSELTLNGELSTATVGASDLAIHTVVLSGGTPTVHAVEVHEDCYDGTCTGGRFATFAYTVEIPGPNALGLHVLDALGSGEDPAVVTSLEGTEVVGAAVYRSMTQNYVVASSARDGAAGDTLSYGVPGTGAARHIVFDAPEDADGNSDVSAAADNGQCVITISAGPTLTGRPLIFQVSGADDGCEVTEDLDVPTSEPPVGGGMLPGTGGSTGAGGSNPGTGGSANPSGGTNGAASSSGESGGCGCIVAPRSNGSQALIGALLSLILLRRRR